jgi:hypothetical protein
MLFSTCTCALTRSHCLRTDTQLLTCLTIVCVCVCVCVCVNARARRDTFLALTVEYAREFVLHRPQLLVLFHTLCRLGHVDIVSGRDGTNAASLTPASRHRVFTLVAWIALECPDALRTAGTINPVPCSFLSGFCFLFDVCLFDVCLFDVCFCVCLYIGDRFASFHSCC